jgi:medium-chain acyl-[acyl-carrier-protein] hydrolase
MITQDNIYTLTKEYPLTWYEVDCQNVLKPSALLNHLQDVATRSADKFDIGMEFLKPLNYAWYLIKYHIEFNDYPQNLSKITLKTESRGISRLFATRDFEIWDEKRLLGRASSQWAMINLNDKSFVKLSEIKKLPPLEKREDDISFPKVNPVEVYDMEKLFDIRYDDIDINQHVNNANYIVWAFEVLPMEFRKAFKPKCIDIIYKKDISYGNKVVSKVLINNQETRHILLNNETNEQLCIINAVWTQL